MIKTDEQRRWWFATHPEYSSSQKGGKGSRDRGNDDAESSQVSQKGVDAYVDKALKYVTGPVADLLQSVKRNFGTGVDSRSKVHDLILSPGSMGDAWMRFMGHHSDGGAFMPRLPTTAELSQWPKDLVRGFFRWIDTVQQNNPVLGDPDKLERHHRLVRELTEYFMDCGLSVDDYIRIMRAADHRHKPDGLHTGKGRGGAWNTEWKKWTDKNPPENTEEHRKRIWKKLDEMEKEYGVDKKGFLLRPRQKRR